MGGGATKTNTASNSTTNWNSQSLSQFLSQQAQQSQNQQQSQQTGTTTSTSGPTEAAKALIAQGTAEITPEMIAQYQNPYQQQVIDSTMAQLNQQYGQQQNTLKGNAISMGALGGDRAKIAQASLMGKQGMNTASTLAGLESTGYAQALAAAQAQQSRLLQGAGMMGTTSTGTSNMTGTSQGTSNMTGTSQGYQNTTASGTSDTSGTGYSSTHNDPGLFGWLGLMADGGAARQRYDDGGAIMGVPSWAQSQQQPMAAPPPTPQGKGGKGKQIWNMASQGIDAIQGGMLAGAGEGAGAGAAAGAAEGAGAAAGEAGAGLGAAAGEAGGGLGGLIALLLANGGAAHQQSHLQHIGTQARSGLGAMLAQGGRARFDDGGDVSYDPYFGANPYGTPPMTSRGGLGALSNITAQPDATAAPAPAADTVHVPWLRATPRTFTGESSAPDQGADVSWLRQTPRTWDQPVPAPAPAPAPTAPTTGWGASVIPDNMTPTPVSTFRVNPDGSQQGALAPLVAPAAGPGPEPGAEKITPNKPMNHLQTAATVFRDSGMSENGVRGMLVNAVDESGGNPGLRHPDQPRFTGEAHYAHGLYQIGGEEWNKFDAWMKNNHPDADWRDPTLQTQFMAQNLKENYPKVWKTMNEGTPEEAAQAYLNGYLKPAAKYRTARNEKYGQGVGSLEELTARAEKYGKGVGNLEDLTGDVPTEATQPVKGATPEPTRIGASAPQNLLQRIFGSNQGTPAQTPAAGEPRPLFDPRMGGIGALLRGEAPPAPQPGEQRGGILQRALGINFNPLQLSDNERMAMIAGGFGGANGAQIGANMYQGLRGQDIQAQQKGQELALQAQQIAQGALKPVMLPMYDDMGNQMHGFQNVQTGQTIDATGRLIEPGAVGAASAGTAGTGIVAPGDVKLQGGDYIDSIPNEYVRERTKQVVSGLAEIPKVTKGGDPNDRLVRAAALHAAPDLDQGAYQFMQKWRDPNKSTGASVKGADTFYDHAGGLFDLTGALPDHTTKAQNTLSNWWSGAVNDPELAAYRDKAFQVAEEKVRAIKGGTPTKGEIEEAMKHYDPNLGAAVVKRNLQEDAKSIDGRVDKLEHEYRKNTSKFAPKPEILSEASLDARTKILGEMKAKTEAEKSATGGKGYQVGEVRNGYRFKGGDPTKQESWEKVHG